MTDRTESALQAARRNVMVKRIEFTALHRDALGNPPAAFVQRIRDAWVEVENAMDRLELEAAREALERAAVLAEKHVENCGGHDGYCTEAVADSIRALIPERKEAP